MQSGENRAGDDCSPPERTSDRKGPHHQLDAGIRPQNTSSSVWTDKKRLVSN